jgi:hypothetical protein
LNPALLLLAALAADPPPAATAVTPPPPPTTPHQVMQRAIDAVGPLEAAPHLRAQGTVDTRGDRTEFELLAIAGAPRRILLRQRLADGRLMEMGCDGETGWMRPPSGGPPVAMEPAAISTVASALLPNRMMLAIADSFPIRSMGPIEAVPGGTAACQRLELEDRDGARGQAWFDLETGHLRLLRVGSGASQESLTVAAWRRSGSLEMPAWLVTRRGDETVTTRFTAIELDPIPPERFAAPKDLPPPAD